MGCHKTDFSYKIWKGYYKSKMMPTFYTSFTKEAINNVYSYYI